jgi:hypothetical protein
VEGRLHQRHYQILRKGKRGPCVDGAGCRVRPLCEREGTGKSWLADNGNMSLGRRSTGWWVLQASFLAQGCWYAQHKHEHSYHSVLSAAAATGTLTGS